MDLLRAVSTDAHEQLVLCASPACGYLAAIAIHDTTLGPAAGGTRFWPYRSTDDAIADVLRLSRGMTYKSAVAGIGFGGGKSIIVGDNTRADREPLFRAHGRFVDSLKGRYLTAQDVGTRASDMELIRLETDHVAGLPDRSGDPSPMTARSVYAGVKASAKERWGSDSLAGRIVAIQGCGNVGARLAHLLKRDGARLIVTDVDLSRARAVAEETGGRVVPPDVIYDQRADVFSPNALGGTLNDATLGRLRVEIVAGGANNQLAEDRDGDQLAALGITYAPDYVINSGGIINVYGETAGWNEAAVRARADGVYDTLLNVFAIAKRDGVANHRAADRLAEERIAVARAGSRSPA